MTHISGVNLGESTWLSIEYYAKMAGWLTAPEAFVQSATAMRLYQQTQCRISIELPLRTLIDEWHVDKNSLQGLGNFRIDLAAYEPEFDKNRDCVTALVEFKLWTNRYYVAKDIRRIKQIVQALHSVSRASRQISGYVVVCPQYQQGITAVSGALSDFKERFPLCYERLGEIKPANANPYGVGVAVIDVSQCFEGEYG